MQSLLIQKSLARRAIEQESSHKETILRYLPFSKLIFSKVTNQFFVHQSITRVISRGDDAVFSRTYVDIDVDGAKRPAIGMLFQLFLLGPIDVL